MSGDAQDDAAVAEDPTSADAAAEDVAAEPSQPNLIDRVTDGIDRFQRSVAPLAVVHAVLKKNGEDRGGQLAMLLAYRGFFSLFPLLLAFVNVIELLVRDNADLRDRLVESTLATVPVIGSQIGQSADAAGGSLVVVVGSVLVSIWAGLGLLEVLQEALNTVWGVPMYRRPPWILRRLRALGGALFIGACLVLSGAATWIFNDNDLPLLQRGAGYVLPFAAGALCYLGLHWLLCVRKVPFPAQLPGAAFMGAAWLTLQLIGTWYVDRFVLQSSDTYGTFVVVFGILSWTYLLGMLYVYANELASVLYLRCWPRSMTGRNLTDQDQDAQRRNVERELRVEGVELDVDVPRLPR